MLWRLLLLSIGSGTKIGTYCKVGKDVVIGKDCKFTSYCEIRDNCILGNEVSMGSRCTLSANIVVEDGVIIKYGFVATDTPDLTKNNDNGSDSRSGKHARIHDNNVHGRYFYQDVTLKANT